MNHEQESPCVHAGEYVNASVWQEDSWFVAQCLEVDIASQGETEAEALVNLGEAVSLHFQPPFATITPQLKTSWDKC